MRPQEGRVERRLAAIFAADVAGYSRLMNQDEVGTLRTLAAHREIMDGLIKEHGGRIANTAGDSVLAEFPSVVEAVQCAVSVQEKLGDANAGLPEERRLQFRIGVHVGDVMVLGGDLLRDGVNVAARLETLSEAGGIVISGAAHGYVRKALPLAYSDLGEQQVKNIEEPIRAYAIRPVLAPTHVVEENSKPVPFTDKASIAVLPFTTMSSDPEQEYFADGFVEDVITELSRISAFLVIARNSTFTYKGRRVDAKEVGRALGVRYVVEGSVRKVGDRVRITAQLIETQTGSHLWADKYDLDVTDVFDVQDEIVRSLVASMQTQVEIGEVAARQDDKRPELAVWSLQARGMNEWYQLTNESLLRTREIGEAILRIAPESAKGHQFIAGADAHRVAMGFLENTPERKSEILRHAREAVRLNRRDEYSAWILGFVLGSLLGRFEEGLAAYQQALEINPNFSLAYGSLGGMLAIAGRADESIANTQIAIRLNPRDPSIFFRYAYLSLAYFQKRDFGQAREWAERAVARKADYWLAHALLAAARSAQGDTDGARETAKEFLQLIPDFSTSRMPIAALSSDPAHAEFRTMLTSAVSAWR